MMKQCWALMGAAAVALMPVALSAQGGARPQIFPTPEQFKASATAQQRVEAARKLAGTDLKTELDRKSTRLNSSH